MSAHPHAGAPARPDDDAHDDDDDADHEPHLLLAVADTLLAVRAASVLEVWEAASCFPVPRTPGYLLGVTNWRGTPLPLLDLAAALGLRGDDARALRARLAERRVVVVQTDEYTVGLVADATLGVAAVDTAHLRAPAVVTAGRIAEFSRGEFEAPRGVAAALDLGALLDATRVTA